MPDYNRKAAVYWWAMVLLGLLAFVRSAFELWHEPVSMQLQVVLGSAVAMGVGLFPIRIPRSKNSFSAGEIFIFLLLLMAGPAASCVAAAAEALVASMRTSKRWTSRLSSPAIAAVSMSVTGAGFVFICDVLRTNERYTESLLIVLVTLLAAFHFLLSSWLIRLVIHLKSDEPLRVRDLLASFGWVGTTYTANAFIAALLYLTALHAGPIVLLAAVPIIALLLSTVHFHFRQRAAEAAENQARVEAAERESALAAMHMVELRRIADHDGLTGLPNRRRFLECLSETLTRWHAEPSREFAVMYLDFDRFKLINDTLGHAAGDEFLTHVSRRIQHQVRHGDIVGRLGGDEFAVLVDELQSDQDAISLAERLQEALRKPYAVAGSEVVSSASIGIAFSRPGYATPADMLRDADAAMFQAKSLGRARYVVHQR
jgi:diguanylate cyclase (GGDEF)-like protein